MAFFNVKNLTGVSVDGKCVGRVWNGFEQWGLLLIVSALFLTSFATNYPHMSGTCINILKNETDLRWCAELNDRINQTR